MLQPIGERCIVKLIPHEDKPQKGNLILLDKGGALSNVYEVVATNLEQVKVGDIILKDRYAGNSVSYEDVEYIILKADDIIALVQ